MIYTRRYNRRRRPSSDSSTSKPYILPSDVLFISVQYLAGGKRQLQYQFGYLSCFLLSWSIWIQFTSVFFLFSGILVSSQYIPRRSCVPPSRLRSSSVFKQILRWLLCLLLVLHPSLFKAIKITRIHPTKVFVVKDRFRGVIKRSPMA